MKTLEELYYDRCSRVGDYNQTVGVNLKRFLKKNCLMFNKTFLREYLDYIMTVGENVIRFL